MNIRTGWPIPMQKEIDAICEQYAGNALTREEAIEALWYTGLLRVEAQAIIDAVDQ